MKKPNWRLIKRSIRYFFQRRIRGWDDSVTWSLDVEVARFMLPRFIRFREISVARPWDLEDKKWQDILEEIEWFLTLCAKEEHLRVMGDELKRYKKAKKLFGKYFDALWW